MSDRQHRPTNGTRARADVSALPRHVAIIMDGNGRWAKARGLPRVEGHRRGVESLRVAVRSCIEIGIPYLTIFSFSSENWSRPKSEINDLLGLMKRFVRRDLADLHKNDVRIRVIGDRVGFDDELAALIVEAEGVTAGNTGLNLTVAFNYGARAEIAKAARRLADEVRRGTLAPESITPERLESALDTYGLPDPDLIIRTSGEKRLSNFLLWQSAYAELVFIDAFWPDFDKAMLLAAISEFGARERRFGGLDSKTEA